MNRGGIRIRLVGLVLICLIPLVMVLVWNAGNQRDQSRRDALDDTLRLSRQSAQRESAAIGTARTLLTAAAAQWKTRAGPAESCQTFVDSLLAQSDMLLNVFAVGDDGQVLCSTRPLPGTPNLIDRPYVQAAIADDSFSAALEPAGDLVDRPALATVLPVDDPTVALLGATMAPGNELDEFLSSVGLAEGSEALLIDRSGVIVAAAGGRSAVGDTLPVEAITARVATEQVVEGSAEAPGLDGTTRLYSFADVPRTAGSAFVIVGIPTEAAFAAGDRELRRNLVLGGLVALVAVTLALAVADLAVGKPVRSIVNTIRRIGAGDLSARSAVPGGANELVEVGRTIDVMAADIQAREHALTIASDERERLLAELLEAQDEERRKIAADIHDDTIQTMIAAGMEVQLLRIQLGDEPSDARLRKVEQAIGTAVTRLRHLMFELEPPDTDASTLAESLEHYIESALGDGDVAVRVEASAQVELAGPARQVLYRNVRESALNASRHGAARNVTVGLGPSGGGVLVAVSDDGHGMRAEDAVKRDHHGLRVMRERTEALGGWFNLDSELEAGTTVSFWLPAGTRS